MEGYTSETVFITKKTYFTMSYCESEGTENIAKV